MTDVIFLAGAPGVGKSAVAKLLQGKLKTPLFEFGWIPEFRDKGGLEISYEEEEQISFENLTLVVKNYLKHAFKNIIVTDLEDKRIAELSKAFRGVDYKIFTLTIHDDETLKSRIMSSDRQNDFRDLEKAVAINRRILGRPLFEAEVRIDTTVRSAQEICNEIMSSI